VIQANNERLRVLSLLNQELFEEVRKKDLNDIMDHFGPRIGKMLMKHAQLEDKFNTVCVEDGVKMTPLDDEFITEEARQCALDIRESTTKLLRVFSERENELKLKAFYSGQSSELVGLLNAF
jgi:hypothetical protein